MIDSVAKVAKTATSAVSSIGKSVGDVAGVAAKLGAQYALGGFIPNAKTYADLLSAATGNLGTAGGGAAAGGPAALLGSLAGASGGLPSSLASLKPVVDTIASVIGGRNPQVAAQLADALGAVAGEEGSVEGALEKLRELTAALGLPESFFMQMMRMLEGSGAIEKGLSASLGAAKGAKSSPVSGGGGSAVGGSSDKGPLGGRIDGDGGFVFKPVSESDGKLVVIAPENLAGRVDSVVIRDSSGGVLASGRYSGNGNGGRDHFRFDRAGGDYPPNITVELKLNDGSVITHPIPQPSMRYD